MPLSKTQKPEKNMRIGKPTRTEEHADHPRDHHPRSRGHHHRRRHREYGRTTITVPCELKQQMKQVGDYVNWSSVACEAFEEKLSNLTHQEEIHEIDQVVDRLRKLNAERESNPAVVKGVEAGKRWAMNLATPAQLDALDSFRHEVSESEWRDLFQDRRGLRELAFRLMGTRAEPKRGAVRNFWDQVLTERPDGTEFFAGFAEGALEVWSAVKDRL